LLDRLKKLGIKVKLLSAFSVEKVVNSYQPQKGKKYWEENDLLLFTGGTGNPFFSTDSAAALRALELDADILLKGTKVDGIYDSDPKKNPAAKKIEKITYAEYLSKGLKVMDMTAIALCQEKKIPVRIFDFFQNSSLQLAFKGENIGSLIAEE
jgi:uridylate kinase